MEELAFLFRQGSIAQQQVLEDGSVFPMVLLPPSSEENMSIGSFVHSIQHNREWIDNQLKRVGALLFRGFPVRSASDFNAVVEAFGWEDQPYLGLASRAKIEGRVYTANEFPVFPTKLIFFCEIAPPEGGQTAIVLSHKITQRMEQKYRQLVRKLEEGLIYPCSVPQEDDTHAVLTGWQSRFQAKEKQELERKVAMLAGPMSKVSWANDGSMVFEFRPLVSIRTVEGGTGKKKAWFNLISFAETPPLLGDGTPFPEDAIESSVQITEEESVEINWEVGDVVVLDSRFIQHARRPATPPRKVLSAFCK